MCVSMYIKYVIFLYIHYKLVIFVDNTHFQWSGQRVDHKKRWYLLKKLSPGPYFSLRPELHSNPLSVQWLQNPSIFLSPHHLLSPMLP